MKRSYFFLLIASILLSNNLLAGKEIKLSYQLKKGQKYALEIKNNQTITMSMSGQSMLLKQQMTMQQDVNILSVDSVNNQSLELTYKSILFKQNAMGMEIIWDSQNPDTTNPMNQQIEQSLGKMIGSAIVIVIDEKGNPISLDKGTAVSQQANLAGFESGMMVVYPDNKLSIGQSWQTKLQPDPKSDFIIESTYLLEEIKGKYATISFNGIISGTQIMGEKAVISGTISGKSEVELETGWVNTASVNQKLEMEMEQQGMKLPMQMSSFIEISTK